MTSKSAAWQPALNSLNRAVGIFRGIFTNTRTRKDGTTFDVDEAYFEIKGEDGKSKPIPVKIPAKYHPENALGELGKALGFVYKPVFETDDEGFQVIAESNLDELDAIIEANENTAFTFTMKRDEKSGLWDINLATLKPFKSA